MYLLVMPKYWVKNYFAHGRFPEVGSRKTAEKNTFFTLKNKIYPVFFFCIYLLVMPKYWVKNYFAHGWFPEVGQKQKTEKNKHECAISSALARTSTNQCMGCIHVILSRSSKGMNNCLWRRKYTKVYSSWPNLVLWRIDYATHLNPFSYRHNL